MCDALIIEKLKDSYRQCYAQGGHSIENLGDPDYQQWMRLWTEERSSVMKGLRTISSLIPDQTPC